MANLSKQKRQLRYLKDNKRIALSEAQELTQLPILEH